MLPSKYKQYEQQIEDKLDRIFAPDCRKCKTKMQVAMITFAGHPLKGYKCNQCGEEDTPF